MSTMKKQEGKRYQNPELFERLAMEYAIGMMHGRARKRFETLMRKHLYLKATTEAYENQFARLAELLPEEKPHSRVWRQVKNQVDSKAKSKMDKLTTPWWKSVRMKMVGLAATVFFVTSAMFMLNPHSPDAYAATLESDKHEMMAVAMVKKGQHIEIQLAKDVYVPSGMQLTLWCISKKSGKMHAMMGVIKNSGTSTVHINDKKWQHLADVRAFAILLSPTTQDDKHDNDDILYQGKLNAITEESTGWVSGA